jgi:glycine/D-amino acid oxidase-like deaminating enzyme
MMGLSLAPITGKLVGQILANEKPALDLGLLSPDRFA